MSTAANVRSRGSSRNLYYQRFKTILDRFKEQCRESPFGGCWQFRGTLKWDGYGTFWMNRRGVPAHRVAWMLYHGEIPHGKLVLHSCDNHGCVNPNHLFLGTHKDNTQDMIKKGRDHKCRESRRGTRSNFAKLSPESVMEIFNSRSNQTETARRFGITQRAVSKIRLGENWAWLTKKGKIK